MKPWKWDTRNNVILEFEKHWISPIGLFPSKNMPRGRLEIGFILIILMFLSMLNFVRYHDDIEHITILLPEFSAIFMTITRIFMFMYNRGKFIEICERLTGEWKKALLEQNPGWLLEEEIVRHSVYKRTLIYFGYMMLLLPFLIFVSYNINVVMMFIVNPEIPLSLVGPFEVGIRLEEHRFLTLILIYCFMMTAMLYGSIGFGHDMLVINLINYTAYYFDYVKVKVRELSEITSTDQLNLKFYEVVSNHRKAIDMALTLSKTIETIIAIIFLLNIFIATFDLFRFIFEGNVESLLFVSFILFHMFYFCSAGDLLIEKSTSLSNELYKLPWEEYDLKMRKSLIIVILVSQRPCKITGGRILTVSLNNLKIQLNAIVSYLTAMRTVFITNA